jgi:hypothetical protein
MLVTAGSARYTPRPLAHDIKKTKGLGWEYQEAGANAGWRSSFISGPLVRRGSAFSLGRITRNAEDHPRRFPARRGRDRWSRDSWLSGYRVLFSVRLGASLSRQLRCVLLSLLQSVA